MDDLEKLILNKIDDMSDEIIKFHQQIVQIPSENPLGKYKEISKFVETKMREIGLITEIKRYNVIGKLKNGNGPTLIIYGHMDTVGAFARWTKDPFGGEIIENRIYGIGSADDKACVTAEIFATKALIELGIVLNGNLIVTAVIDEEAGGYRGAGLLLNRGLIKGDACLLGDGYSGYPVAYYGGCILVSFQITGKKIIERSDYYDKSYSTNAIQKMVKILNFLIELQEEFKKKTTKYPLFPAHPSKYSNLNLSKIQGGNSIVSIPRNCILYCYINTVPENDVESIKIKILNFVEELNNNDTDLKINVQFPILYEHYIGNINSIFAKIVNKSTKTVFGEVREFKLWRSSSDAHFFVEKGIETIIFGTACPKCNFHSSDEFVKIDDLIHSTKMFAIVALNYLH